MDCIELMVEEHRNIKRMLVVIRKQCHRILKQEEVRYEEFFNIIDFIRNYADRHHHGKEETLLFNRMAGELGTAAEKLVRHGMLVEHDMGRLHVQELETAVKRVQDGDEEARLDVIAHAIGYAHLLNRHIDKEDNVVYQYARNHLAPETWNRLNEECEAFEQDAAGEANRRKYLKLLEEMEARA